MTAKEVCWAVQGTPIVEDVSFELSAGEVLGLIGPNGGGKSSLMMMLAGLVSPDSGSITINGLEATHLATSAAGTIGLITAEPGLYPLMTGRENLHWFGGLYGLSQSEVDRHAMPLLQELSLTQTIDNRVSAMSSGMRQKVSLIRALLTSPKLLLLDEPTANLDPLATHVVHQAVRTQADQGIAIVLCTHNLQAAELICDRVALLDRYIRALQTLDGPRAVPPQGQLHSLYQQHVGAER